MTVRVAVNGFGRIGRNFLRAVHARQTDVEIVALNDLVSPEVNAYLLRYDSTHGRFDAPVSVQENSLVVDGKPIAVYAEREPKALPWGELGIDVVVESTGRFTARAQAADHIDAGARRVVISAPSDDADATFVIGVNDEAFDAKRHIVISNASCTTNCFVPLVKVLDDAFGVQKGLMTTVHAYTNDQELLDLARDNVRRGRAGAQNIVPVSTGAARATHLVLEQMKGKLNGTSLRVPVSDGSITDFTAIVSAPIDVAAVNAAFQSASQNGPLSAVLVYNEDQIVSSDIVGSPASCTFDSTLTMTIPLDEDRTLVKVFGWYDNEWGYSNRLVDLVELVGEKMKLAVPRLEDLPDVENDRVLVRTDFNVPITEDENGQRHVGDAFRVTSAVPTLRWLMDRGAIVTVCTSLGRPHGKYNAALDLEPIRAMLSELVPGVAMMDNLRFDPGEEADDPAFVQRLIADQDLYVNDAFGVSHRAHASVIGPPRFLPSTAGRLLEKEVEVLSRLIDHPIRPFVAVVGGTKVADKMGVLNALCDRVDTLIVGGGMAYTFLAAQGHAIGDSLLDESRLADCEALLHRDVEIVLPVDIVALGPGGKICSGAIDPGDEFGEVQVFGIDLPAGWEGVDMGPRTRERYAEVIGSAKTVLWNGPVGVFEDPRFVAGTRAVAEAIASCPGFSVVGGGDSVAAIDEFGLEEQMDYVSTGGGATLELIEFGDLPGLAAFRGASNAPRLADASRSRP